MSYTEKETATVVARYVEDGATVETIAAEVGKSVASVRAKLVAEDVYVAKTKTKARKGREVTKAELVAAVEAAVAGVTGNEVEAGTFDGLAGATKASIEAVFKALTVSE